jgi:lipid II:glycine glycyltransferase (peptidoglycan interpeptide bridge formation enzyme)
MVVVESLRGFFRLVEVYYPRLEEIDGLADNLTLNQILYMRQMPESLPPGRFSARYVPFNTSLYDLTRDEDILFADMNRTCRQQVRKMQRLCDRIEVHRNDTTAYHDFLGIHNDFAALKKHSERLSEARLEAYKLVSDVMVAYFDGRPICGHLILRDPQLKRVGVLLSASTRLNGQEPSTFISSLNRWLHWYEMRCFKSEGMKVYDICGIGTDTPETAAIANFKKSFGGTQVLEHNYVLACAAVRAAVSLFYMMRRIRSRTLGHLLTTTRRYARSLEPLPSEVKVAGLRL